MVTGGAGFIGSHIVDAYINDGYQVIVIDNLSTGKRENLNSKAKFYECDICSDEAKGIIEREKPEVINHHAAQIDVRESTANPLHDIDVNVKGLVSLLEVAKDCGLKRVILASSGGAVYGEQNYFPVDENHSTRPLNPYGINKLISKKYLHYYKTQYDINYIVLRYANVYGPRQNADGEAGVIATFINKMLTGGQPIINGDGKQTRDYIYVEDVVEANRVIFNKRGSGIYNVGTGKETDVNAVFCAIKELTNSTCLKKCGPPEWGEQQRSSISSVRISRDFDFVTKTPFIEGLKCTVQWFKNNSTRR